MISNFLDIIQKIRYKNRKIFEHMYKKEQQSNKQIPYTKTGNQVN